jgi:meiotic recombination protein SPO11
MVTRSLTPSSVRQLAVLIRVADGIHELLSLGRHSTKRELFYTDVNLFEEQTISDRAIEDLAVTLRTIRNATNIVASAKGKIIGRISFVESGDLIDCSKMGTGGKAITPFQDQIENIDTDAEFVLLVEKDAAFMSLSEAKIYERYPCILMTGIGQPDIATRMMLRKIVNETGLPVFAIMDADPYGLEILRSYTFGSKALGYETPWLVTENMYWLGLRPEDMENYKIPKDVYIPLTEADKKKGKELLEETWLQNKPKWAEQLKLMLKSGVKAEIQALASKGFEYMSEKYLPQKLESADWI